MQRKRPDGVPTTTTVQCIGEFGDKMLKPRLHYNFRKLPHSEPQKTDGSPGRRFTKPGKSGRPVPKARGKNLCSDKGQNFNARKVCCKGGPATKQIHSELLLTHNKVHNVNSKCLAVQLSKLEGSAFSSRNLPATANCIARQAARGRKTQKRMKFEKVSTLASAVSCLKLQPRKPYEA